MTKPLQGVALVTGGGRGIGRAIAERLASDGMRVAIAARTRGEVGSVAEAIGAMPLLLDVTDRKAVAQAVDAVLEKDLLALRLMALGPRQACHPPRGPGTVPLQKEESSA